MMNPITGYPELSEALKRGVSGVSGRMKKGGTG